jgi:hypothetical protein
MNHYYYVAFNIIIRLFYIKHELNNLMLSWSSHIHTQKVPNIKIRIQNINILSSSLRMKLLSHCFSFYNFYNRLTIYNVYYSNELLLLNNNIMKHNLIHRKIHTEFREWRKIPTNFMLFCCSLTYSIYCNFIVLSFCEKNKEKRVKLESVLRSSWI